MNIVRELRRLNLEGHARTDVENLFLLEMATSDYRDLFKESTELDMIMSNDLMILYLLRMMEKTGLLIVVLR